MSVMKKQLWHAAAAAAALGWSAVGTAGVGHYMPGMMNIRDFLVPEQPGMYTALYLGNYSTDKLKDRNGNTIDKATFEAKRNIGPIPAGLKFTANLDASVDMYLITPAFIWNSGYKVLGADYAMLVALPFANTSIGASLNTLTNITLANRSISRSRDLSVNDNAFDISDIYVQPLWLGWHGTHYDISAAYAFYAPTGKYDKSDIANTGLGFWSNQFQLSGAYYPFENKGTALMLAGTYEIHGKTQDKDLTQGSHFTLNWGLSQYLPITDDVLVELGPAGYSQWQVEDTEGADAPVILNAHSEVHAVGGQIGLALPKANAKFTFHYFTEFEAEARFQGDYAGFSAVVGF